MSSTANIFRSARFIFAFTIANIEISMYNILWKDTNPRYERNNAMKDFTLLQQNDPEVYEAVMNEVNRQRNKIELIASENFVSETVMETNGTPLTNKYAEGYPGKRYYGGCEFVDVAENPVSYTHLAPQSSPQVFRRAR